MPKSLPRPKAPQTVAVSSGIASDAAFGAITPPIVLSSNFAFGEFGRSGIEEDD